MANDKLQKDTLYVPPAVTSDVVIFTFEDGELKILLIKRANAPFKNSWALPGGFLHRNETSKKAALRILKDKAGVENVYIEQLYTFDEVNRDPRGHVMTIAYFALVPHEKLIINYDEGVEAPVLFSVKKLPKLAFDHKSIVAYALQRLRSKLKYTNLVFSLLPEKFTFSALQKTYETILGSMLDKRNFRKKFMSLGIIKPLNETLRNKRQRPAGLFTAVQNKDAELEEFI